MPDSKVVQQAAAIPFRASPHGGYEVLLVSQSSGGGWGVPKGGIKRGSTPLHTAMSETLEETGVLGEFWPQQLGSFSYSKRSKPHRCAVFALEVKEVLARWQEEHRRARIWVPLAEAHKLIAREPLKRYIYQLRHKLLAGDQSRRLRNVA